MANKYLAESLGRTIEVEAIDTSAGAADAGKLAALDASGKWPLNMMPTGVAPDVQPVVASEALAAGDVVNIYDNAGTANVRKADATTEGKEAHGFVVEAFASGATADVYKDGSNDQVTGLSIGNQYLDTTPGQVTGVAPQAAGNVVQQVGVSTSATTLSFEADQNYIVKA